MLLAICQDSRAVWVAVSNSPVSGTKLAEQSCAAIRSATAAPAAPPGRCCQGEGRAGPDFLRFRRSGGRVDRPKAERCAVKMPASPPGSLPPVTVWHRLLGAAHRGLQRIVKGIRQAAGVISGSHWAKNSRIWDKMRTSLPLSPLSGSRWGVSGARAVTAGPLALTCWAES